MKIEMSNIKIEWLSTKALVLISIFASAASKRENKIINLREENVLQNISDIAKASDHAELKQLYTRIKHELKMSLYNATKNERFAHDVMQLTGSEELESPSMN
jgi:hypothetical protein